VLEKVISFAKIKQFKGNTLNTTKATINIEAIFELSPKLWRYCVRKFTVQKSRDN
jgi:hypothetical protein